MRSNNGKNSNNNSGTGNGSGNGNASPNIKAQTIPAQELSERKKLLKQQLKKFDADFLRDKGRMPKKVEKEPIRHLYEQYNALKSLLETASPSVNSQQVSERVSDASTANLLLNVVCCMRHQSKTNPVS